MLIFSVAKLSAQDNVGIGTTTPDPSALLEMLSSNKGVLVPRMNTAGMNAIAAPGNSLLIYNTDSMCFFFYRQPSSAWISLCSTTGTGTVGATGNTGTAGVAGNTGATGSIGATGVAGTTGITGTTGDIGATGVAGVTGATGAAGTTGITGATGDIGATGVAGITGATGDIGATGATGIIGITGATGDIGATGVAGITGATGDIGATGATGTTGIGIAGTTGATGATGLVGPTGFGVGTPGTTGSTGATGSTGIAGTTGVTGSTGVAGATGTVGTTGATGNTGIAGTTGVTGSTGVAGVTGNTGVAGNTGSTGATGSVGTTGATGSTGIAGATGVTGSTGVAGATGDTGATGPTWTLTTPTINTSGTITINGTAGSGAPVTTTAQAWIVGGNTLAATGAFGTVSNNHVDLVTNNLIRGRLSNLGEFFIGTTATALAGDLMNGVSNATFPWAVNGYSSFNGGAVYGGIMAGTTQFAGVQGEYYGTATFNSAAVRGINANTSAGTGFRTLAATGPRIGVAGNVSATTGSYTFGIHGSFASTSIRCGAVYGDDFGIAAGGLGYYASTGVDYGVYGFGAAYQIGTAAGLTTYGGSETRSLTANNPLQQENTQIGLGIYGGVMGGWVRGLEYGFHAKGNRYGLYVDGTTFTNSPITQLINVGESTRIAAQATMGMSADVQSRGNAQMMGGQAFIQFSPEFMKLISDPQDLVITVTPRGSTNGVYVSSVTANGFTIMENYGGTSSVQISWIAVVTVKGYTNMNAIVPPEVSASDFDGKMNGVMFNDNNTSDTPTSLWWDGSQIRFDHAPAKNSSSAVSNARVTGGSIIR